MTEITARLSTALADRYQIERHLGEGGMANVYLAEDLKHHRKVAVKVLRPELAAVLGAERFVHEIETTANLQHPHILPLFDSGDADGFLYYVMPFIDGETLRDKLNRETQLGIEDAVSITTAIADALDYAHRNNVIHRDIKPENILLHDGRPMVADFGIALALSAAAGGRMTETGMSLGTPHYMSPEQATAEKDLTNRSDIYSLGSMLYEMLTGEPPHMGGSAQAIIMKIVTDEVRPVTELRKSVPPHVAAATAKSLEKLAADRFATAKEFAEALTNPAFALPTTQATQVAAATMSAAWNRLSISLASLAAVLAVVALWGWLQAGPDAPKPVARYEIAFPEDEALLGAFAISPDGSMWAYVGPGERGNQVWIKRRADRHATPLAGTDGAVHVFFSPDGVWVGFIADDQVKKIPAGGGAAITLAEPARSANGQWAAWLEDGTIVFVEPAYSLARVSEAGGSIERVVEAGAIPGLAASAVHATGLPEGRGVLFTACSAGCSSGAIWTLDLRTGVTRALIEDALGGWYVPTGHVLYANDRGGVFAVPFDLETLELGGAAVPVLDNVSGFFAMSGAGDLLYLEGTGLLVDRQLVWVERDGTASVIDSSWTGIFGSLALSPDGMRLAVDAGADIWIKQLDRGPASRLTFADGEDSRPTWTPDGQSVTFISERGENRDSYAKRADGTGSADVVLDLPAAVNEGFWSPNGDWLIYRTGVGDSLDLFARRSGQDTVTVPLVVSPEFNAYSPALSPGGRWLAYVSDESGRPEVYVRPFPDVESGRWQVSVRGGTEPMWAHSGRELFYKSGGELVVVDVGAGPVFAAGQELPLFPIQPYFADDFHAAYDVTPDDRRFVMIQMGLAVGGGNALILVENFLEELKAKVGN
ncbi:MAG: protein kinase [Gemmatimonadetes bacterium]|nr:protein kinase [Gemmatimonadota bacterium]